MSIEFVEVFELSKSSVRRCYVDLTELLASGETLTGISVSLESGPSVAPSGEAVLASAVTPQAEEIAFGSRGNEIAIGKGIEFVATIPDESGDAVVSISASSATQTIERNCRLRIK